MDRTSVWKLGSRYCILYGPIRSMIVPITGSAVFRCWMAFFILKVRETPVRRGQSYSISMSSYYSRVPMLAAVLAAGLVAQDDTIKVDVDLVNILCSVRGKNNALIGNLDKGDFHLFEDGKEQEIKYFTRETDLPLTIGLLVDVSGSQERLIDTERRAASAFFRSVLRPKDLAFLISFGKDSELLQDSTSSPKLLEDRLKQLRLSVPVGGVHPGPVP